MDDSMVAVLPSDLATEAQSLRRELEIDRLFSQAGAGSLSAILRHSGKFCRRVNTTSFSQDIYFS